MKTLFKQHRKFLVLVLIFALFTCSHEESSTVKDNKSNLSFLEKRSGENATIYYGISTDLFDAYEGRSWVSVDKDGFPKEIGIEYKYDNSYDNWGVGNEQESSYTLSLPEQARALTPFEHIIISLDYPFEQNGQLSTEPHMGFRFYTISTDERMAIPAYDPENQSIVDAFNSFPNRSKMPSDYFMFPGDIGVGQMMGKQWLPIDYETRYQSFEHALLMGSYTGKNIFLEPRSTYDYIYSVQDFSGEFSQPETFEEAGNNYPTKYNIFHDLKSGNIYVTLSDFVTR